MDGEPADTKAFTERFAGQQRADRVFTRRNLA